MAGCSCAKECSCECDDGVTLLYACSGMANTGFLADRVWRRLAKDGIGSGTCLSAIGAGLSGYVTSAREATRNIVIDGCGVACGAKIFEKNGLRFEHYVMTDFGVEKGKTPVTDGLVESVTASVKARIEEKAQA